MARRVPEGPPPAPTVQRLRVRYAKRGRLRFTSHRDFARAFERALRRADVPMAYSAGFTPHPKISYVGASPTGVASEAEYLEIGLTEQRSPEALRAALDAALPDGIDIVEVVPAGPGSLADRMEASHWRIELPGVSVETLQEAVDDFLARAEVPIERMLKTGLRTIDVRAAVISAGVSGAADHGPGVARAILDVVVRQVTPTVRPDDVLAALRSVAGLAPAAPPLAVRVAQGPLDDTGPVVVVGDPLAADRSAGHTAPSA
ncbi:MAG: TIGR03936 family radical SAM-associated protein [Jatrophihabitans sp.]|uniref:TIGR03936 family radical SAM-associated protein n=1 Tax=Jatrophihabitans sp. TaxID=1932789 RepID=UPI003F7EEADE